MPVSAPDGTPRCLYLFSRNNGYDINNPDPTAPNEPDLSPPDPLDPNYYHNTQVLAYVYVADDTPTGEGSTHKHFMPTPGSTQISQDLVDDPHFHYSWIKQDGGQKWTTENLAPAAGGASNQATVAHDHEVDVMQIINSLGEQGMIMRPKWCFALAKVNNWTHQHWVDTGGGRTIIVAERPYISGNDANPNTWEFADKASNIAWDQPHFDQINGFMLSRFGLALPVDDGNGDSGVNNDRRFMQWWHSINQYQFQDETRFG